MIRFGTLNNEFHLNNIKYHALDCHQDQSVGGIYPELIQLKTLLLVRFTIRSNGQTMHHQKLVSSCHDLPWSYICPLE